MAVTANQIITAREPGGLRNIPVATGKRLYQGTMVFMDASGFATDVIAAGANEFCGIAKAEVDNTSGANGDKVVEVFTKGAFELVGTGFTQANVNYQLMYATDNYVVTVVATSMSKIGRATEYVSATKVMVDIDPIQT